MIFLRSCVARAVLKLLLNLLTPQRCICGDILTSEQDSFCQKCWPELGLIGSSSLCLSCGLPFEFDLESICSDCTSLQPHFDKARSVFKYNDISGKMITGLKYQDKTPYAKTLAKLMAGRIREFDTMPDIITSVPVHPRKLRQRKYNQSAMLANKLGKFSNLTSNNLILRKVKDINPQASLTREERIKNVKGAYVVNNKYNSYISGKNVLLVDDVLTTGATASECAAQLKRAGAAKVYVLTAARTLMGSQQ